MRCPPTPHPTMAKLAETATGARVKALQWLYGTFGKVLKTMPSPCLAVSSLLQYVRWEGDAKSVPGCRRVARHGGEPLCLWSWARSSNGAVLCFSVCVSAAGSASVDAWRGARSLCAAGQLQFVSRAQYAECGAHYLAEPVASNQLWSMETSRDTGHLA